MATLIWKFSVSIAIMQYRISIFSPRNVGSGRGQLQQNLSRESGAEQQSVMPETKIRGVEKLPDCFWKYQRHNFQLPPTPTVQSSRGNKATLPKPKLTNIMKFWPALKVKMWFSSTTRMVSASGGSPSKSESLVKDDSRLAAKKQQVFTSSRSWVHPFLPPALCVYSDVGEKAEENPKIKMVFWT